MKDKIINIEGGIIYSPYQVLENKRIVIKAGIIEAIEDLAQPRIGGQIIDAGTNIVVPGLIDMHLHGGGGREVMEGSVKALETIKKIHGANGTTTIILSTMSASLEELNRVIKQYHNSLAHLNHLGSEILGIHLEGPLLNPEFAGAQQIEGVVFSSQEFINLINKWTSHIKMITIAPELPAALKVIEFGQGQGIIMAAGHTGANYQQGMEAINLGVKHFTHFFNAMPAFHHREPGLLGAVLNYNDNIIQEESGVTIELIADGKHLHPGAITLAMQMVGKENCILVSDASSGAGMQEGRFTQGLQEIEVRDGAAYLVDGTLAGSTITLNQALNYLVNTTSLNFLDVLPMATINPARKLGITHDRGSIEVGKRGDIAIFNESFRCLSSIINGELMTE